MTSKATTKAISFQQPYASLIVSGCMQYIFRRGKPAKIAWDTVIAIHAAKSCVYNVDLVRMLDTLERYGPEACGIRPRRVKAAVKMIEAFMADRRSLPSSAIIGQAKLVMPIKVSEIVIKANAGAVDQKLWAWPFTSPKKAKAPIGVTGSCGVWDYQGQVT